MAPRHWRPGTGERAHAASHQGSLSPLPSSKSHPPCLRTLPAGPAGGGPNCSCSSAVSGTSCPSSRPHPLGCWGHSAVLRVGSRPAELPWGCPPEPPPQCLHRSHHSQWTAARAHACSHETSYNGAAPPTWGWSSMDISLHHCSKRFIFSSSLVAPLLRGRIRCLRRLDLPKVHFPLIVLLFSTRRSRLDILALHVGLVSCAHRPAQVLKSRPMASRPFSITRYAVGYVRTLDHLKAWQLVLPTSVRRIIVSLGLSGEEHEGTR